jgi:hypothetical protein
MTKILHMTRSRGREGSDFTPQASDPLEPTRPLSPRSGDAPFPLPLPIVRPWFPAPLVLRQRPPDLPRIA